MTCVDAGAHIDAFVDGELSPSASVDVARHVGQCARCDGAVRRLLTVREALIAESERAVAGLDLSRVWPSVDAETARLREQAAWRERRPSSRRLSRGMAWGTSIAAIAAGAALFLRVPGSPTAVPGLAKDATPVAATRVAAKRLPNHVLIDRLAGKDIALRREPKSGTTMIWVNHEVDGNGW
jgi:anti-sigma factor RsiW